ncbi:hypothetical protein [Thiolapillus sp.]|uniref:hypothetical protein n=1 Tax=Thiolapillus sp. TaxID=2017437 RepID=UPI0025FB2A62|nr:hypothetical protein [Thiolapillus sp.]
MTRTAGAPIGCQRPSRFWGLGCPKIYHEVEDTLVIFHHVPVRQWWNRKCRKFEPPNWRESEQDAAISV